MESHHKRERGAKENREADRRLWEKSLHYSNLKKIGPRAEFGGKDNCRGLPDGIASLPIPGRTSAVAESSKPINNSERNRTATR